AGKNLLQTRMSLNAFGFLAVTATLVFYACEGRSPGFILAFGAGCLASAVYGFLQGAWPFGVIEIAWTVVAVQRWRQRIESASQQEPSAPLTGSDHIPDRR